MDGWLPGWPLGKLQIIGAFERVPITEHSTSLHWHNYRPLHRKQTALAVARVPIIGWPLLSSGQAALFFKRGNCQLSPSGNGFTTHTSALKCRYQSLMKLKEGVDGTICWKERKLKMCPLDRIPPLMRKNRAREGTLDTGQDTSRHSRPSCRHFKQHTLHCEVKSCWKYKCGQAQAIGKFGIRGSFPFVLDTGHFLFPCQKHGSRGQSWTLARIGRF